MQTIRRLYFYAVALVSLETVIWGLIGLMRSVASPVVLGATADRLAAPLAFILVGLPVFLLHWRYIQRLAAQSADEATARLRALFFYVALTATLLPTAQNALAFLSRTLTRAFRLESSAALLGSGQSVADNLIAVGVNLILALYFYRSNDENWKATICPSLSEADQTRLFENYRDARRLYRYFWLSYSLALTVLGVRQVLSFLLIPPQSIGLPTAALLANGLALLTVGLPIWFLTQRLIDRSLEEHAEAFSWLRLIFLFALTWLSMFLTLYQLGKVGEVLLRLLLGEELSSAYLLQSLRPAFATLLPMIVVWRLYGKQRQETVARRQPYLLCRALDRFHATFVASVALTALIIGSSRFLAYLLNQLFAGETDWLNSGRGELSASLAILLIAVPVWIRYWQPLQREAALEGEQGDHARRSLVRKASLYLWIFVGVVGTMFASGSFFFEIMRSLLGTPSDNLVLVSLLRLRLTLIFLAVLLHHWNALRRDQRLAALSLSARHANFPVAIWLDKESALAHQLKLALQKEAPLLPILWLDGAESPSPDQLETVKALVISTKVFEAPSADEKVPWKSFGGQRLVIPDPQGNWYWVGGSGMSLTTLSEQTARTLRLLAEGQSPPRQTEYTLLNSIAYVLAGLFLLQIVVGILLAFVAPVLD